ncbi:energy transducer TonB [Flavobacteriaceae bacterium TP-CH-4]|uniref:Energy transducer TonB n=1 Tax=Pelagihabitans pacificus TaxID=2696054 RepID=A0A967AV41_9FLAO|nr:energy transducer TonB [Pelagihabitans pacificus]NHF60951.1 energy transducer TonB [Pelagihabitans pacificus]
MELKKNKKADLNRNRGLYFITGLVLVMALSYIALEWKTYDDPTKFDTGLHIQDELTEPVPIILPNTPPPPPPPIAPTVIEVTPDDDPVEETVIESSEPDPKEEILDVREIKTEEVEEDVPVSFIVVEDVPIFPGCEEATDKRGCFQTMMKKHIEKHFRYPEIEREMGIQGKVSVLFEIQKDGSIGNVRMRGPNENLENEAARIIYKLPKMTPGKQRGTPVRVPFAQPIVFRLQN